MEEKNNTSSDGITTLMTVPSIGELTARVLVKEGYEDIKSLEDAGAERITKLECIDEEKVKKIFNEIRGVMDGSIDIVSEFICPKCGVIVMLSLDVCPECGADFASMEEQVFLPGGILLDDPLETLAEYDVKIADGKDDEDVWFGRACILESMGAYEAAYESYDNVIEFDPLYDQIWNAKARLAMKLGKMNEAAKAYKLAVNSRMDGLEVLQDLYTSEAPPEEVQPTKEHSIDVQEVEETIGKARAEIARLKGKTSHIENLQELLSKASAARNNDEREKAVQLAKEVLKKAALMDDILPLLEEIEEKFYHFEDDEESLESYYNQFQELIQDLKDGHFQEVLDKAKKVLSDMDERLSDKDTLSVEKEEILTEEKEEEEIEEILSDARRALADARETGINLDNIKENLKEGLAAKKKGSLQEAREKIKKVLDDSQAVVQTFEVLDKGKNMIGRMREAGLVFDTHLNKLKKSKTLADKGSYQESITLAQVAVEEMEEDLSPEGEEEEVEVEE
ncbi:MAG: hypothetical protein R6U17_06105, partial [Thermoplasmata archaeon]